MAECEKSGKKSKSIHKLSEEVRSGSLSGPQDWSRMEHLSDIMFHFMDDFIDH